MITIPDSLLRQIDDHTEASYPYECCGLMIGTMAENKTVHAVRRCKNLNVERPHDRYYMDPLDILHVQQEFENSPWQIIGFYHSHPDHSSQPSQEDTDDALAVAWAWSGSSYLIVSVQKGRVVSAQSWVLNEAERKFYEEPWITGDSK